MVVVVVVVGREMKVVVEEVKVLSAVMMDVLTVVNVNDVHLFVNFELMTSVDLPKHTGSYVNY